MARRFIIPVNKQEPVDWMTTDKGSHIPIYDGQTKKEAIDNFAERQIAQNKEAAKTLQKEQSLQDIVKSYNVIHKRWTDQEYEAMNKALYFMTDNFGDLTNIIQRIEKKKVQDSAIGHYDPYTNAVEFKPSKIIREELFFHEFTHAITEYIAGKYKQLGYENKVHVLEAMATDICKSWGTEPIKWNRKNWECMAEEFISWNMERFASTNSNNKYKGSEELLNTLKKWWKKVR